MNTFLIFRKSARKNKPAAAQKYEAPKQTPSNPEKPPLTFDNTVVYADLSGSDSEQEKNIKL